MIDKNETLELIVNILNNNIGNKLTVELASGIMVMLNQHVKEKTDESN